MPSYEYLRLFGPGKKVWGNFAHTVASIPNGNQFTELPWTPSDANTIFDLTDPTAPVVGVNALVSINAYVSIASAKLAAGKSIFLELDIDANGADPDMERQASLDPAYYGVGRTALIPLSHRYFCPAGGVVQFGVAHDLAAALTNLGFYASVTIEPV